jgi:hypothetical protein
MIAGRVVGVRVRTHVRFGSKADMCNAQAHVVPIADIDWWGEHVRFAPRHDIQPDRKTNFRCYDIYGSPGLNGNSLPGGTLSSLIARIIAAVT